MIHELLIGGPHDGGNLAVGESREKMVDIGAAKFTDFCFFNDGLESRGSDFWFSLAFEETADE